MRKNTVTRTVIRFAIVIAVATTLTSGMIGAVAGAEHQSRDTENIEVCHVPAGNPSNAQLITVSEQGWENGHSNHGDDIRMDEHPSHHPDHQHSAETMCEHHGEHVA